MHQDLPLLLRFMSKLVLDILPAALASVIGGFLFTQYHIGRAPEAKASTVQAEPASAEMMQLVRDEHALIVDVLKAQAASEKTRHATEQEERVRAVAEAEAAQTAKLAAAAATRRVAEAEAAAQRTKVAAVAGRHVADGEAAQTAKVAAAAVRRVADGSAVRPRPSSPAKAQPAKPAETAPLVIARQPDSGATDPEPIRSRTALLADDVVAGTKKVAAAIVGIPSWIGERFGRPPARNPEQEGRFASVR